MKNRDSPLKRKQSGKSYGVLACSLSLLVSLFHPNIYILGCQGYLTELEASSWSDRAPIDRQSSSGGQASSLLRSAHLGEVWPLMSLMLGCKSTIIISFSKMAFEILKNHDLVLYFRPPLTTFERHSHGGLDIALSSYGE